jgi:hypothetical protein
MHKHVAKFKLDFSLLFLYCLLPKQLHINSILTNLNSY